MDALSAYSRALWLLDDLAREGARLSVSGARAVQLHERPLDELPEALRARLVAFIALPELDRSAGEVAAALTRSTRAPTTEEEVAGLLRAARDASPAFRALRAIVAAPSREARELLALPLAAAAGLPVPFTVRFARKGSPALCTTSRQVYAATLGHLPVFLLRELEAAAQALAVGRAGPAAFDRWLEAKRRGEWVLTPELAGARDLPSLTTSTPPAMCFGELFDGLGVELAAVEMHPEPKREARAA